MAAKEGAAQSHFNGVGAVMNTLVSFSDDDDDCDLGLDDDFIDGGAYGWGIPDLNHPLRVYIFFTAYTRQ